MLLQDFFFMDRLHLSAMAGDRPDRKPSQLKKTIINMMQKLTIYYDGECPLCLAEIHFLKSRNSLDLFDFVDVAAPHFDENVHQLSCKLALATMQGRLADGTQLEGIPVFAEAYKRANLPTLAWLFSRSWLTPLLNAGYYVFAKYRHSISKAIGPTMLRLSKRFASEPVK